MPAPRTSAVLPAPRQNESSTTPYLKLEISALRPDLDRYVFLDADVIVRSDIGPLFEIDLDGCVIAAVQDGHIETHATALPGFRKGAPTQTRYLNTGVMCVDAVAYKKARISERAYEFIDRRPECISHREEDALNAVLQGDWRPLTGLWNVPKIADSWPDEALRSCGRVVAGRRRRRRAPAVDAPCPGAAGEDPAFHGPAQAVDARVPAQLGLRPPPGLRRRGPARPAYGGPR